MKPGRELDALVAEKVMGLHVQRNEDLIQDIDKWRNHPYTAALVKYGAYLTEKGSLEHYSTSIAAAWEVVDHLRKTRNLAISLHDGHWDNDAEGTWIATFETPGHVDVAESRGESSPHAICLAALKAVGHIFPSDETK